MEKRVNLYHAFHLASYGTIKFRVLLTLKMKTFENIVGKGENTCILSIFLYIFYCNEDRTHHLNLIYFIVEKCFQ